MQFVCKDCFADKELIGFIVSQNMRGDCDSCHKKDIEILPFEELLDFFKELIDNFQVKPDGNSLVSLIQGNWSLFSNLTCGNTILNFVLNKLGTTITNSSEFVDFNAEILENVNYWFKLKEQLKWERRYFTDINYLTDDLGWDSFFESKVVIKTDETFYRARLHNILNTLPFTNKEMFCPPKEISSAGRANPKGIPYLYLSDNPETILYEIRASYLDEVTIALFKIDPYLKEEVIISDFTEDSTLYHPNEVNKKIKSRLLKKIISRDLSKPMRRYDSDLDYIPTQFICEFIKIFTNVQGIKFRSSLHDHGNNLVLFNQNLMNCVSTKKVRVSKVIINSKDI
ncbi:MAG: RES domain-containing protein [Chitinophagaceae bacterium]